MDDIIVIILTLVFAVAGIFGQMKKKRAANQAEDQPNPRPELEAEESGNFWDFLDAEPESMEQAPVPDSQQQRQSAQPVVEKTAEKEKPAYKFGAEKEGASIYAHDLTSDEKTEKARKTSPGDRFSLKKAVIYNEILNRKYT